MQNMEERALTKTDIQRIPYDAKETRRSPMAVSCSEEDMSTDCSRDVQVNLDIKC